jgi:hypothetical protein
VLKKRGHVTLAEAHDLVIGSTSELEIGTAFSTAERETCQRVFEGLLEPKEFE